MENSKIIENEENFNLLIKKREFLQHLIDRESKVVDLKKRMNSALSKLSRIRTCLTKLDWVEGEFYSLSNAALPLFYDDFEGQIKKNYQCDYAFRLYFEFCGLNLNPIKKGFLAAYYQLPSVDKKPMLEKSCQDQSNSGYQILTADGLLDCPSLNVAVQLFTDSKAVLSIQKKSVANGLTS